MGQNSSKSIRKSSISSSSSDPLIPITISYSNHASLVFVTGTFNNWNHKIQLLKSNNSTFSATINMTPGIHRLKFIIDNEWKCSNDLPTITDEDGNLVNYISVSQKPIQLSPIDDILPFSDDSLVLLQNMTINPPETIHSTDSTYSSTIPNYLTSTVDDIPQDSPMLLPAAMEKLLLNSKSNPHDPSILDSPNHVVLNHLYTCSIKDNTMAVSTTCRYKQKYVTTIFYKPIL